VPYNENLFLLTSLIPFITSTDLVYLSGPNKFKSSLASRRRKLKWAQTTGPKNPNPSSS